MKKQIKINLEKIAIQSFVTNLSSQEKVTFNGGGIEGNVVQNKIDLTLPNNDCYHGSFIICVVVATTIYCPLSDL